MTDAAGLAQSIEASWAEFVSTDIRERTNRPYAYASDFHPCTRYHVLTRTDGDKLEPWDVESMARFRRGKDRERDLLNDLARVGRIHDPPFELVGGQERFELKDRYGRPAVVGKVDTRLQFGRDGLNAPAEIKAWSRNLTSRIHTFEDLFFSKWTRKGAYQSLCYLLGSGEELAFLILDRPGIPRLIPVEFTDRNLDRAERFLAITELANDYVELGDLPDYYPDPWECHDCPFYGGVCNPPMDYGGGSIVIEDPEFEAELDEYAALQKDGKRFNSLHRKVAARLKRTKVEKGLAGPHLIEGKWSTETRNVEVEGAPGTFKKEKVKDGRYSFTVKAVE